MSGREQIQQTTCANARLLDHLVGAGEPRRAFLGGAVTLGGLGLLSVRPQRNQIAVQEVKED